MNRLTWFGKLVYALLMGVLAAVVWVSAGSPYGPIPVGFAALVAAFITATAITS